MRGSASPLNLPTREHLSPIDTPADVYPSLDDPRSFEFKTLQAAFARTGGLATGDQVAQRLLVRSDQAISLIARMIVKRQVVAFEFRASILIPLFQFDIPQMRVRPEVSALLLELNDVLDDWDIALWFSEPNDWLRGSAPVDSFLTDPEATYKSARTVRYVMSG
ncbi:MAG TPA: hypothetical protein VGM97_20145 [Steroidobacteraceae bacterium]|jgi:hypothetical protein